MVEVGGLGLADDRLGGQCLLAPDPVPVDGRVGFADVVQVGAVRVGAVRVADLAAADKGGSRHPHAGAHGSQGRGPEQSRRLVSPRRPAVRPCRVRPARPASPGDGPQGRYCRQQPSGLCSSGHPQTLDGPSPRSASELTYPDLLNAGSGPSDDATDATDNLVGIVLVSHSAAVASSVAELARGLAGGGPTAPVAPARVQPSARVRCGPGDSATLGGAGSATTAGRAGQREAPSGGGRFTPRQRPSICSRVPIRRNRRPRDDSPPARDGHVGTATHPPP